MKRYLLDTNVVSELRKPRPHGSVVAWVSGLQHEQAYISTVTLGKLQAGVERTRRQDPTKASEIEGWVDQLQGNSQLLPMDAICFREWARLMNGKSDQLTEDGMIAATARIYGLIVATRNEGDFRHFAVPVFNPFAIR